MPPETDARELDAAIAERLFGFTWGQSWIATCRAIFPPDMASDYRPSRGEEPLCGDAFRYLPRYSTTGDGMLLVIEAMRERGWGFFGLEHEDEYSVIFHPELPPSLAPTLPLATTRAALAALDRDATANAEESR